MSIEEKRRADFYAWFDEEIAPHITGSRAVVFAACEKGWNAALDGIAPQVSDLHRLMHSGIHHGEFRRGIAVALGEFEAAGVKVKP